MSRTPKSIKRTYYALTLGSMLAASPILGINMIFLLDAGLSNLEAFGANAFFTAGMVLFEVPTGIVADVWGRRVSFLLGAATLAVATALYVLLWWLKAPFWEWAAVSFVLALGFTFFSGATEAWLVDALTATGYEGSLERVFGRGQVISGAAMFVGSVAGGYLAQLTNLAIPYVLRAATLVLTFVVALVSMHDIGFTPRRGERPLAGIRRIAANSIEYGWRVPAVKYLMLASAFTGGVAVYVFYALQPYLLSLYGNPTAYAVAGLVAAISAGSQILGGMVAVRVRRLFRRRTSAFLATDLVGMVAIILIGLIANFWAVLALIAVWGLMSAAASPIRQALINGLIPSQQRATILSFDSLMASSGGIVTQPALGGVADVWGYPLSFLVAGGLYACSVPYVIIRARQENTAADVAVEMASPGQEVGGSERTTSQKSEPGPG